MKRGKSRFFHHGPDLPPEFYAEDSGNFGTTDSTAHATSRLEIGFVTEKFKPFFRTASSEAEDV
jgi:hypothetical protein